MSTCLIDPTVDQLRPVNEIVRARLGKRVSPATLWRWVKKGVKGVRLEVIRFGGTWCTKDAAFAAFLRAQTDAALADVARPETTTTRTPAKAARLRKAGLSK